MPHIINHTGQYVEEKLSALMKLNVEGKTLASFGMMKNIQMQTIASP